MDLYQVCSNDAPGAKKIPFPLGSFEDFFSKKDTFLILKLLITFLKELVVGQGSFSAKCTGYKGGIIYINTLYSDRFPHT